MMLEEQVYKLLKREGISQTELAADLGMTPQRMNDILHGRRRFGVKHIIPVCKAMGCEPNELFGYEKENHQITVTDDDGQVIAAVIGDSVVEHDGYHIILS